MMTLPTYQLPWVQGPADELPDLLRSLSWKKVGNDSAGRDVAALMIYIVMLFLRKDRLSDNTHTINSSIDIPAHLSEITERFSEVTYDEMAHLTGLSRSLINQGLQRLFELRKITPTGSNQHRIYNISWNSARWYKLPCRAILTKEGVLAFKTFSLRSKHELNALKLYLYLASIRDGAKNYSEASYEKIFEKTGVSERDIRRAINILTTSGLLARVNRESDRLSSSHGPNQYYLTGYVDFSTQRFQPRISV